MEVGKFLLAFFFHLVVEFFFDFIVNTSLHLRSITSHFSPNITYKLMTWCNETMTNSVWLTPNWFTIRMLLLKRKEIWCSLNYHHLMNFSCHRTEATRYCSNIVLYLPPLSRQLLLHSITCFLLLLWYWIYIVTLHARIFSQFDHLMKQLLE